MLKPAVHFAQVVIAMTLLAFPGRGSGAAAAQGPKRAESPILARVNGEPVTLADLSQELADLHQAAEGDARPGEKRDVAVLLDRLINIRLIVQEGIEMGLDELPEARKEQDSFRKETLQRLLSDHHTRDIHKGDPEMVERLYREATREYRLAWFELKKPEDARSLAAAAKRGGDFAALGAQAVDRGVATAGPELSYVRVADLVPGLVDAVSASQAGDILGPLPAGDVHLVVRVLDRRDTPSPEARKKAEADALARRKGAAMVAYSEELRKRYARVDEALLESLDFEAPGVTLEKLLEDPRPLVTIQDAAPIAVKDLVGLIRKNFYHGVDQINAKRVANRRKHVLLERMVLDRVTVLEALALGLDRREELRSACEQHRRGVVFGLFVQKVIDPDVKLDEARLRKYLADHAAEFTSPESVHLESLAFNARERAEETLARLRKGADRKWTRDNASGLVALPPPEAGGPLFLGSRVAVTALPEGLRTALAGAEPGEYRLYPQPDGPFHVLLVRERVPARVRPFEEVAEEIAKRAIGEERTRKLEEVGRKLRRAGQVEVLVTGKDLERLVRREFGDTR